MNNLLPDLLSGVITCVERAGDMLVAEFHRIPGHEATAGKPTSIRRSSSCCASSCWPLLRCRFVGEETGSPGPSDPRFCWIVDPHDGTSEFLQGQRG